MEQMVFGIDVGKRKQNAGLNKYLGRSRTAYCLSSQIRQ